MTFLGISKRCSTEWFAHSRVTPTVRLPHAEAVVGIGVSLVVALLVLPPMGAVVLAGTGSGFAPLHHPDVVLNTLLFGLLTTLCAMLLGGGLALSLAPGVPGRVLLERLVVMPLYLTPLLTAMGWSWLASPEKRPAKPAAARGIQCARHDARRLRRRRDRGDRTGRRTAAFPVAVGRLARTRPRIVGGRARAWCDAASWCSVASSCHR